MGSDLKPQDKRWAKHCYNQQVIFSEVIHGFFNNAVAAGGALGDACRGFFVVEIEKHGLSQASGDSFEH